jgi:hypothetical protein
MKDSVRRIILFVVIVITGSVLILFDIPIIFMVPIIIVVGFTLLLLLGAITMAEIRTGLGQLKYSNLKKTGALKKLDTIKFFKKKAIAGKIPAPAKATEKKPAKPTEKRAGIRQHLDSLLSSVKSLGQIIRERGKPAKKVEDIDKLLDKTVTEKVRGSALASAGTAPSGGAAAPGGAGGGLPAGNASEQDPFLSLSGDELENGLLDSLDGLDGLDTDTPSSASAGTDTTSSGPGSSDLVMEGIDMPALPDDLSADADAILKENAGTGLEEFSGLDGEDAVDQNFDDLDNINIDDIDLGEDIPVDSTPADQAPATIVAGGKTTAAAATPTSPDADVEVKFSLAANQVPAENEQVSVQEEISFGPGPTGDDDLLSSLASEIKHVKKEKDLSLLRDLKDFKAPASDIEQELQGVVDQLTAVRKNAKPVSRHQMKDTE